MLEWIRNQSDVWTKDVVCVHINGEQKNWNRKDFGCSVFLVTLNKILQLLVHLPPRMVLLALPFGYNSVRPFVAHCAMLDVHTQSSIVTLLASLSKHFLSKKIKKKRRRRKKCWTEKFHTWYTNAMLWKTSDSEYIWSLCIYCIVYIRHCVLRTSFVMWLSTCTLYYRFRRMFAWTTE